MAFIQGIKKFFSKWPKTRRARVYLWRIIGLFVIFVFCVRILIHLNEIPTKTINLAFDGYGVQTANVNLDLMLGGNTNLEKRFDSTYKNAFLSSNVDGVSMDVDVSDVTGNYLLFNDVVRAKGVLRHEFPMDSSVIAGFNAMLRLHMVTTDVNQRLRMFNVTKEYKTIPRKPKDTEGNEIDNGYMFKSSESFRHSVSKNVVISDENYYFFLRDSLSFKGAGISIGKSGSFIYNSSFWQESDISQAYVGIHLSDSLHNRWDASHPVPLYHLDSLSTTLSIDFGSPVTISNMAPAPDSVSMTGLSFLSKEKVERIIRDGLIFHVTFDQNKNLQAVKLFWVTTIVAALFGLIFDQAFKWWRYHDQRRRNRKRLTARVKQNAEHTKPQ